MSAADGRDRLARASRSLHGWLLVSYTAFVVCASLFPFGADVARLQEALHRGFADLSRWRSPTDRDLFVNLAAYVPVAVFASLWLRGRFSGTARWIIATASGAALSLCIELLQYLVPIRVPSVVDWVLNTSSSAVGASLAAAYGAWPTRPLASRLRSARVNPGLVLLVILWLAAHAQPFMPRLRPRRVVESLEGFGALPLHWPDAALYAAAFLVLANVVRALVDRATFWGLFATIVSVALAARLLFVGQALAPEELIGLAVALPAIAWVQRRPWPEANSMLLVLILLGWLLAVLFALPPRADAGMQATAHAWWPFAALFVDQLQPSGAAGLLERAFVVIGLVWIAASTALGPLRSLLLLLALALAASALAPWPPGPRFDTTDVALVLLGALLARVARRVDAEVADR